MNKTTILVAGTLGLIIGFGLLGVRRYWLKKSKEYDDYYSDFHRHFDLGLKDEPNEMDFLGS